MNGDLTSSRTLRPRALLALAAVTLASCPRVPIQARRAEVVLHYEQRYNLACLSASDTRDPRHLGHRLLAAVLGAQNYCGIALEEDRNRAAAALLGNETDRWRIHGLATAVMMPSPWSLDEYSIEAIGRYIVSEPAPRARLIATADFYVEGQSIQNLGDLLRRRNEEGLTWVDLKVRQLVVREVDEGNPRYAFESALALRLYLKVLPGGEMFTIADRDHEVGIIAAGTDIAYSVGCMRFSPPSEGRKLFDLRGRGHRLVRSDYRGMVTTAGLPRSTETFTPVWYGPRCPGVAFEPGSVPEAAAAFLERPAAVACGLDSAAAIGAQADPNWHSDPDGSVFESLFDVVKECPKKSAPTSPEPGVPTRTTPAPAIRLPPVR